MTLPVPAVGEGAPPPPKVTSLSGDTLNVTVAVPCRNIRLPCASPAVAPPAPAVVPPVTP